ncbi:MAG: hypothetical protein A2932_00525 [Candidatus Spechtbacteria bacterium RIFCSPLOWO2_01_FULL_46_10]|uniref:PrgI family protein n=1 Tax=Candidatus Spechtbacteria bacterium RIFCSPLOWO2_01_FULL_46_10 TaxID=1802163 RepID=A0A1G2HIL4_9BACT|nr:MAG: hypothetical protein A2932_00525 [Candidatus Spechtbacteria bacterium RIFCSPLOWO2_01_FULL_46_10]
MAQYEVPQFIERETKLLGPLTFRQTIILAVIIMILFGLFFFINTLLFVIVAAIMGGIGAALVFIQINGRPFSGFLAAYLGYFWNPKFYSWRKQSSEPIIEPRFRKKIQEKEKPQEIPEKRIKEIAEMLDK